MIPIGNIHPLTDFKRNTSRFRTRLRNTGRPELLTIDGRPELVVQSAEAYERMLEIVRWAEDLKAIEAGLRDGEAGRGRPFDEWERSFRRKHKLRNPRRSKA